MQRLRQLVSLFRVPASAALFIFLAACGTASEDSDETVSQLEQSFRERGLAPLVKDDYRLGIWEEVDHGRQQDRPGYEADDSPGRRWYRGKAPVDRKGIAEPPIVTLTERALVDDGATSSTYVTYDPSTNSIYEVEMPANDAFIKALEGKGYQRGSEPSQPDAVLEAREDLVDKEWGSNTDGRTRKTSSIYNKIGRLSSGCTGTFIGGPQAAGQYFVITAAHCIFSWQTGAYFDPSFSPYQEGTTKPHGEWDGWQWMMPSYFLDNCTSNSYPDECAANDIAILRVGRPTGESYPGAYGFGSYAMGGTGGINDRSSYLRGYPGCGTGRPDATECSTYLWGDNWRADLETSDPNVKSGGFKVGGWNRLLKTPADTNPGNSGSSLYHYDSGQKVYGVWVSSITSCYGSSAGSSCPAGEYPNFSRRIEPQFYGWILDFMDDF